MIVKGLKAQNEHLIKMDSCNRKKFCSLLEDKSTCMCIFEKCILRQ